MSKLREQFLANDRLREYVERMLSVIIENNPQLLEITANGGVPIGSVGMASYPSNQRRQSTTQIENKSVPSQPLQPTESMKSETSSTPTTTKQPNDKYCRL
jgi:hypothetical protein